MTPTLEQELEQVIADADYRVIVAHAADNYLKVRIVYLPHLNIRGQGAFTYIAHGLVAEQHFTNRSPARRWRRAAKWARAEIAGHRELAQTVTLA